MANYRTYGTAPYRVAVIHGGPGAAGEMAPVARELARDCGVLEPLQTATSLDGQVEELRLTLEPHGKPPVALVGFSWGAWLGYILAAQHPALVRKLLLISSGPFDARYVAQLHETRMRRLNAEQEQEWRAAERALNDPATSDKDSWLARLGALALITDAFDPLEDADAIHVRGDLFHAVWAEAAEMRASGALLGLATQIRCPVVAVHGDHDSHPAEGVREPLAARLKDFRMIPLKNCGHTPWLERQARDEFYRILREELGAPALSD